ncbi:hypothetical protein BH11ARM1_BH11ARM1_09560 [soil metagenome]
MRWILVLGIALMASLSLGQGLFETLKPDLLIVVSKHPASDNVEVMNQAPDYPKDLMLKQVERLGELLNSPARGTMVQPFEIIEGNPKTAGTKIIFAVTGLINKEANTLGLQTLARAFALGPKGQPNKLWIQYSTEGASTALVQKFESETVALQAHSDPIFGLEYKIDIRTQDPDKIVIPEGQAAIDFRAKPPSPPPAPKGIDRTVIILILVAALALGALVYSLLLRPRSKSVS